MVLYIFLYCGQRPLMSWDDVKLWNNKKTSSHHGNSVTGSPYAALQIAQTCSAAQRQSKAWIKEEGDGKNLCYYTLYSIQCRKSAQFYCSRHALTIIHSFRLFL